jgi:hypothetical protein
MLLALDNAPRPTCPPPIQSHYWRALLPETLIWHWDQTSTGAALQSTHELEVTPFSPTTLMSLGAALSSTKIVHTLFSTQPYENTRPFYALPQGESKAVALAVKKIIGEIATRFNDMYPLYVLASSHSNNSSSIATVERHTAPPRKHATRKRHKHDKRDP